MLMFLYRSERELMECVQLLCNSNVETSMLKVLQDLLLQ